MIQELIGVLQHLPSLTKASELLWADMGRRFWLVGNGGSAAVASHIAADMVRRSMSAIALVDPPTLSASANDFGWGDAFAAQIAAQARGGDVLIAISSSGRSDSILRAVKYALHMDCKVLTLSAFDKDNPLRKLGHVKLWVDTHNYGVAEAAHLAMLHEIVNP